MTAVVDVRRMKRAFELAERGRGQVEPNPMVGAVVVNADNVVGEGAHSRFGGPHAEIVALDQAGAASRDGELYVTLEPCCHHGKTAPCTDRVLASGVRRVVIAMRDPFAKVAGQGIAILRDAGLRVEVGLLEDQARLLNAAYLKRLATGRPFVHAKWAMTLDGKIATGAGQSKWISNETSRRHAHAFRGRVDGIVVGVDTVLADDPLLTARPPGSRVATRVVLDSTARIPLDCQLVGAASEIPTLIATTSRAPESALSALRQAGCECITFPGSVAHDARNPSPEPTGRVPIAPLLDELGRRGATNVLVEGGAGVLASFLHAGQIDAVRVYVAPRLVGGRSAKSPIGGRGVDRILEALQLGPLATTELAGDLFLTCQRPVETVNSED